MIRCSSLLHFLFLLTTITVFAQSSSINYSTENGLSTNTIYCSIQDSNGYLWFGTNHGVSRFNGFTFENFTIDDGLTDNEVFKLFQDSKKRIWFLTHSGILCYFLEGKFYNPQNNPFLANQKFSSFFTTITELTNGDLLFFKEYSTECYVLKNNTFSRIQSGKIFNFVSLYKAGNTPKILAFKLDSGNNKIYFLYDFINGQLICKDSIKINSILTNYIFFNKLHIILDRGETGQEKLSMYYGSSLSKLKKVLLDEQKDFFVSFPYTITQFQNKLYLSTSSGEFILNDKIQVIGKLENNKATTSILVDFENGKWLTTRNNGIYYHPNSFVNKIEGFDSNINKIIANPYDENELFITSVGKFFTYNLISKKINATAINSSYWNQEPITDIEFLERDNLVISSTVGIVIITNKTQKFASNKWKGGIKKILIDKDSVYFARSSSVLKQSLKDLLVDSDPEKQKSQIIFHKRTFSICKDLNNDIWLGAIDGVYKKSKNSFEKYFPNVTSRITSITYTIQNDLIFSSDIDGVYCYKNGNLKHITTADGLISNQVNSLSIDNKNEFIWISTTKGISKLNAKTFSITENITAPLGLSTIFINDLFPLNDSLILFATPTGLYELNHQKKITSPPPFINIVDLRVNSIKQVLGKTLNLSHTQNNIELSFSGISYLSRRNIEFWYAFGKDTLNWKKSNSANLNFLSLAPDNYFLALKCKNSEGTWSKTLVLPIQINVPFYKSFTFIATLFLLLVLSIILLFYLYKRRTEKENRIQLLLSETKQKALRAQLNPHFIFNALNSIQFLFLSNKEEKAQDYLSKFSTILRNTLNNSDKTHVSLQEELVNLQNYVDIEKIRKESGFNFEILIDKNIDKYNLMVPSMLLQPIVENAIWHGLEHSKNTGEIVIRVIHVEEDAVKISVSDNGIGYTKSTELKSSTSKHQSKGTTLIYDRIQALNSISETKASMKIFETPNGTTVELILPNKYA
ncbi:MAG: histidine kinase [Bacteroidetes bacterium]|nr:histidine kinase [Bacteroidota bacterium]